MSKTKYISALFLVFGLFSSASAATFSDVPATHTYIDAVHYLAGEKIVQGYDNGEFRPDITINRAEFLKIITASSGLYDASKKYSCFSDIPADEWFTPYVCSGKEAGIVGGYPDGTYRPGDSINFVEALKIVSKAYKIESPTTDVWYEGMVRTAGDKNLIPITIRAFDHKLTRAEMSDLISRFVFYTKNDLDTFLKTRKDFPVTFNTITLKQDIFSTWKTATRSTPPPIAQGSFAAHLALPSAKGRTYSGDGKHAITTGDQVNLNNGVTVEIVSVANTDQNEFVIKVNYYLQGKKLNYFPLSLGQENNEYGTKLTIELLRRADADPNVFTIDFVSMSPQVVLQDLFTSCLSTTPKHDCYKYSIYTPLAGEAVLSTANYQVIYPEKEKKLAEYFLNQLHYCTEAIKTHTDLAPSLPYMPLRIYYDNADEAVKTNFSGVYWPIKEDSEYHPRIIDNATGCFDRIMTHELVHVAVLPAFFMDVLNEAIAYYHEHYVMNKLHDALTTTLATSKKMNVDDSFVDSTLGITVTYLGISQQSNKIAVFKIHDDKNRFEDQNIGVGVNAGVSTDQWTTTEQNLVIFVESLKDEQPSSVVASFYHSPPARKLLTCNDNSYTNHHGWRTPEGKSMSFFQYDTYDTETMTQPGETKNFIALQHYLKPGYPWVETFEVFYSGGACLLEAQQKQDPTSLSKIYALLNEYKLKSVSTKEQFLSDLIGRLGDQFKELTKKRGLTN